MATGYGMTVGPVGGSAGRTSTYDAGPSKPGFDFKSAAGATASLGAPILDGFLQRAAYKRQARWAKIGAEFQVGNFYAAANRAGATDVANLFSSGFSGGEGIGSLVEANRAQADEDAALARFNADILAEALKTQGRLAVAGGFLKAGQKAATAYATGGAG